MGGEIILLFSLVNKCQLLALSIYIKALYINILG